MSVFVNEPRIASWTYRPTSDRGVERPPDTPPLRTTYDPRAGTVVVGGELFGDESGRRVLPTVVSVADDVLSVQFDELDGSDSAVASSTDGPFSLCVHFEDDLPDRTRVTYVGSDGRRVSNWPNPPAITADDD